MMPFFSTERGRQRVNGTCILAFRGHISCVFSQRFIELSPFGKELTKAKQNESRKRPFQAFYSTRGTCNVACCSLKTQPAHSVARICAKTHLSLCQCLPQFIIGRPFSGRIQNLRQKPSLLLLCKTHGRENISHPDSRQKMTTSESSSKFAHFFVNTSRAERIN